MSQVHKERRVVAERGVCWGEKEQNSVTMAWRHVDASGERAESGGKRRAGAQGDAQLERQLAHRRPRTASKPHPHRIHRAQLSAGGCSRMCPAGCFPGGSRRPGYQDPFDIPVSTQHSCLVCSFLCPLLLLMGVEWGCNPRS